jgi:hypothetical protein
VFLKHAQMLLCVTAAANLNPGQIMPKISEAALLNYGFASGIEADCWIERSFCRMCGRGGKGCCSILAQRADSELTKLARATLQIRGVWRGEEIKRLNLKRRGVSMKYLVVMLSIAMAGVLSSVAVDGQTMSHPGVLVSGSQLDFVKAQVRAKAQPFQQEYEKAVASQYAALDYQLKGPPTTGVIDCGPVSNPDHGCHAEDADASAAYLQALLWYLSGDHRYADNAIRIANAYGHGLHAYTGSNAPLQAAWSGEMWPRSAEILRYSNSGWKEADIAAFSKMLTGVILPLVHDGSGSNGNWELSMIDAMMGIAVFTDDRPLLTHAETMWRERVPAYFYNAELDGAHPRPMPRSRGKEGWYGTTDLNASVDGISQETCRDLGHTGYGIASTMAAAETAHIQGDHLFEAEQKRLVPAMEFHARLFLREDPVPTMVCGGVVHYAAGYTFAVGYNEYHNRLHLSMPATHEWLEQHVERSSEPIDMHMMVFEPLTHAADASGSTASSRVK